MNTIKREAEHQKFMTALQAAGPRAVEAYFERLEHERHVLSEDRARRAANRHNDPLLSAAARWALEQRQA